MRAVLLVVLLVAATAGASPVYDSSCEANTTAATRGGDLYLVVRVNERAVQVWEEENGLAGLQRTFCVDKVTGTFYEADARVDPVA